MGNCCTKSTDIEVKEPLKLVQPPTAQQLVTPDLTLRGLITQFAWQKKS